MQCKSEALIFASTNPQYDDRLFIDHENCKLRIPAEQCCFCFVWTFRTILVHNMLCPACNLIDTKHLDFWCKKFKLFLGDNYTNFSFC